MLCNKLRKPLPTEKAVGLQEVTEDVRGLWYCAVRRGGGCAGADPGHEGSAHPPRPGRCGPVSGGLVGLGHRRLSIIDLAHGKQPMSNEDGRVWVVFIG